TDRGELLEDLLGEMQSYAPQCVAHMRLMKSRFLETLALQTGTAEIVSDLARLSVPLYGITNWSAETFPQTRASLPVFRHFEDIIVSGVERVVKPDAKIFELAIARWSLTPPQTVFVDDRRENVEAAERAGLKGIHFQDSVRLRQELSKHFPILGG